MSWAEKTIGDLVELQRGHDLPDSARQPGTVPVIGSAGLTGYHNVAKSKGPGVTLGRSGASIGKVTYVSQDYWPHNACLYVKNFKGNDPRFVAYLLKTVPLAQLNSGAAQPSLNRNFVYGVKIKFPDPTKQSEVVEILDKYDDLIENNKRRIELLEESARQLYKEWFVRFRFPGHEHVKIIDGVPEGWNSQKVGELLRKVKRPGKVKKESYLDVGDFPCVDQSQDFVGGYTNDLEVILKEPLPLVVFGDHTRVLKFVDFPFACGADGTQLLHPCDSRLSIEYFYFALVAIDLSNYFYARHFKFLKDQIILIPSEQLVRTFTDFASINMKQVSKLRDQNMQLALARDLLLPKLMSGEIAV